MMGLQEIRRMNADAGHIARGRKTKAFLLKYVGQLDSMPPFPFPNFGDKANDMDKEYKRIGSLFCDSGPWGGGISLSAEGVKRALTALFDEHGPLLLAVESQGEFQLHLGVWKVGAR